MEILSLDPHFNNEGIVINYNTGIPVQEQIMYKPTVDEAVRLIRYLSGVLLNLPPHEEEWSKQGLEEDNGEWECGEGTLHQNGDECHCGVCLHCNWNPCQCYPEDDEPLGFYGEDDRDPTDLYNPEC